MNKSVYKIQQILFVEGVFLKDCVSIDDIFEKRLLDKLHVDDQKTIVYGRIPTCFVNLDTWVKSVNVKCWYCDLTFTNMPIFIPNNVHKKGDNYNINTHGCFCSFACAQKYINIHYSNICDYTNYTQMLKYLYFVFYNKRINDIVPSPDKYEMVHYSNGTVTVSEYKTKIKKLNRPSV
jgi:hypothetical protein